MLEQSPDNFIIQLVSLTDPDAAKRFARKLELEDEIQSLRSLVTGGAETTDSGPGNAAGEEAGNTADTTQEGKS